MSQNMLLIDYAQNMEDNFYKNRIIELGLASKARLMLPENDSRIDLAKLELSALGFDIINNKDVMDQFSNYKNIISTKKFTDNWENNQVDIFLNNPVNFAMIAVLAGDADAVVAGATNKTSDIIRSAIRIIGLKPNIKWVSSIFYMIHESGKSAMTYSDCGVIPEPNSEQLVCIAESAYSLHKELSGEESKIAFLSFSTKGSASHYKIDRIKKAVELFGKENAEIEYEGEIQFDAAVDSRIRKRKIPNSKLKSAANTFIFPDLDSGNIAYKITERLGGYHALGPLLTGLNKPIHDLSRGCSVDDIVNIAAIAALQKEG